MLQSLQYKKLTSVLLMLLLLTIVGCANSMNENDEGKETITQIRTDHVFYFTGTIKEIFGNTAIVYAQLGGSEGHVLVSLSVNKVEEFQVEDKIKVGYDGVIMESNPAKVKTLSVEKTDK